MLFGRMEQDGQAFLSSLRCTFDEQWGRVEGWIRAGLGCPATVLEELRVETAGGASWTLMARELCTFVAKKKGVSTWSLVVQWQLLSGGYELLAGKVDRTVVTHSKEAPRPVLVLRDALAARGMIRAEPFGILRAQPGCKTPTRNPDVQAVVAVFREWVDWSRAIRSFLNDSGAAVGKRAVRFMPETVADCGDMVQLSRHWLRSELAFSQDPEARLLCLANHFERVASHVLHVLDGLERWLRAEFIAVVGKSLTPADFARCFAFHAMRHWLPPHLYRPFSFAFADGFLSIEEASEEIRTVVSRLRMPPMQFVLNSACSVSFTGEQFLHVWVRHAFGDTPPSKLVMHARARPFSSFLVLLGRLQGSTEFAVECGMLLQGADAFSIPLNLFVLPTAQQFSAAISSLSQVQQRFASSMRAMQLASMLFAVLIIPIRPQLEQVLHLPLGALEKEPLFARVWCVVSCWLGCVSETLRVFFKKNNAYIFLGIAGIVCHVSNSRGSARVSQRVCPVT